MRRRRLAALLLLVALTVTTGAGWWMLDGRFIDTPALAGLSEVAAQDGAEAHGLTIHLDTAYSETVPAGQVISTDPNAGTDIERGGTMTAIMSQGPERFSMPRVIGMKRDDAAKLLTGSNLAVGTINEDWDEELVPGLVTKASAQPGDQLRRDERVDLTLSKGPKPLQVPNQAGKSAKQAQAALERAGFEVTVRTANSRTVPEGHVISQDPASGVGKRGDTITLVRSVGPALVAVPEVTNLPTQEAVDVLTQAGFKVASRPDENYLGKDVVARTDPVAGQQVPEGTTITLLLT